MMETMCIEDMKSYIREFLEDADPSTVEELYWLIMGEVAD